MKRALAFPLAAFLAVVFAGGCAAGSSAPPISIALSPASVQTDQGQTVNITASVENDTSSQGVSWSLSGPGTLSGQTSSSVTYNAPSNVTSSEMAAVTATSLADAAKAKSTQITVNPVPQITLTSFPSGTTGTAYNQTVTESGGTAPFAWSVYSGAVPNGLILGPTTGAVSGTPTGGGTWNFELQLTDATGFATYASLSLMINSTAAPGNPVPFVNQPLVPDAAAPAGAGFTLIVNGAGFVSGATVDFNGTQLTPASVTSQKIMVSVPAGAIAAAGTASVTVVNPTPGGGSSNVALFLIAAPSTTVSFANASGSPIPGIQSALLSAVVDFNGDGVPDLAVEGGSLLSILLGNGDGMFTQASGSPINLSLPQQATDPVPASLAVGDFNNDGKLDVAVADSGYLVNNVPVLLGNGDGTFTPSTGPGTTGNYGSCSMAAADFNADGNLDLMVGNDIYGIVSILLGYGDGAFNQAMGSPISSPMDECAVAVGDFNGDGKLDLAIANASTASVTILLGNGDGTFTPASGSPVSVGNGPNAIAAGDFNGDGKLDLAVANYADSTVTVLLGNGDGTFTQADSPISVGSQPDAIAVGDFLANGKLDLAVANYGSNNVTLLLGNGDGTFAPASISPIPVGSAPTSIVVADFNHDGLLDLAVTNSEDSTVSILLQQDPSLHSAATAQRQPKP